MHGWRHEVVTERVHRHQRRHPDGVAEVVAVDAAGERRACGRLGCEEPRLGVAPQNLPDERERQAREVRPAADAPDDHVWLLAGHRHLRDRLLADDRLVQAHVVEHRAKRVVGVIALGGDLDGLGDRDPERPRRMARVGFAGLRQIRRRAVDGCAPGLDHRAAIGLLVVARADHEHLALDAEQRACERERGAPLPGAGLRREPLDPGLRILVGLGDGGVGLVRPGGRYALVLVVDVRGGIERALPAAGAEERCGTPQLVGVTDGLGDLDLRLGRDLLKDQRHREDRREVVGAGGLERARM